MIRAKKVGHFDLDNELHNNPGEEIVAQKLRQEDLKKVSKLYFEHLPTELEEKTPNWAGA
jgi:hypothetical protein